MSDAWGMLATWFRNLDYGTVPSWISAFGSIVAFSIAVWAARASWKQVEHLTRQKEQEQSSKVAAWVTLDDIEEGGIPRLAFYYANTSGLPVHNLCLRLLSCPDSSRYRMIQTLALPTSSPQNLGAGFNDELNQKAREYAKDEFLKATQPADPQNQHVQAKLQSYVNSFLVFSTLYGVESRFTDMSGTNWIRDRQGALRKDNDLPRSDDYDSPGVLQALDKFLDLDQHAADIRHLEGR